MKEKEYIRTEREKDILDASAAHKRLGGRTSRTTQYITIDMESSKIGEDMLVKLMMELWKYTHEHTHGRESQVARRRIGLSPKIH